MRSLHSHNRRGVVGINKLIGKIAHLHRPDNRTHEKHLTKMIAQTWRAVELILSQERASALPVVRPEGRDAIRSCTISCGRGRSGCERWRCSRYDHSRGRAQVARGISL